jgi:hypothetical protein
MSGLKLIRDAQTQEHFGNFKVIQEGVERDSQGSLTSYKSITYSGPYMVFETKNRNGRQYLLDEGISEVDRYQKMIRDNRSVGELEHPEAPNVNLKEACHICVKLEMAGNIAVGTSKVLSSTPTGRVLAGLMVDGVKIGTSSRALGELDESTAVPTVRNFYYICNDMVHDPSAPGTFVENVLCHKEWVIGKGGVIVESAYDHMAKSLNNRPVRQTAQHESTFKAMNEFLIGLKTGRIK